MNKRFLRLCAVALSMFTAGLAADDSAILAKEDLAAVAFPYKLKDEIYTKDEILQGLSSSYASDEVSEMFDLCFTAIFNKGEDRHKSKRFTDIMRKLFENLYENQKSAEDQEKILGRVLARHLELTEFEFINDTKQKAKLIAIFNSAKSK